VSHHHEKLRSSVRPFPRGLKRLVEDSKEAKKERVKKKKRRTTKSSNHSAGETILPGGPQEPCLEKCLQGGKNRESRFSLFHGPVGPLERNGRREGRHGNVFLGKTIVYGRSRTGRPEETKFWKRAKKQKQGKREEEPWVTVRNTVFYSFPKKLLSLQIIRKTEKARGKAGGDRKGRKTEKEREGVHDT